MCGARLRNRLSNMKLKLVSAVLLVVVALGIVVQSLDDPEVPLGSALIMVVAALITWLVRNRWGALAAVVACLFLLAALAATGSFEHLVAVRSPFQTVGLWIQTAALAAALVCATAVLVRPKRAASSPTKASAVGEDG
jgi:hypothetical protein